MRCKFSVKEKFCGLPAEDVHLECKGEEEDRKWCPLWNKG